MGTGEGHGEPGEEADPEGALGLGPVRGVADLCPGDGAPVRESLGPGALPPAPAPPGFPPPPPAASPRLPAPAPPPPTPAPIPPAPAPGPRPPPRPGVPGA